MTAGHQRSISSSVETCDARFCPLIHANAGQTVATTQKTLCGPEFNLAAAEIHTSALEEAFLHRPFGGKENVLDFLDLFFGKVAHDNSHGPSALEVFLQHGLNGGVFFVTPVSKGVQEIGTPCQGDIEKGRVDILDNVIDEGILKTTQFCAGSVSEAITVTRIAREVIHAVKVAVVGKAKSCRAPG